jgi:hypothetical protein
VCVRQLIATPPLDALVHFADAPVPTPIAPRRSPLLTNGHGVAGADDHAWEGGMPLGDAVVKVLLRAWAIRAQQRRESMSPK